jgi:hypothetical protein
MNKETHAAPHIIKFMAPTMPVTSTTEICSPNLAFFKECRSRFPVAIRRF